MCPQEALKSHGFTVAHPRLAIIGALAVLIRELITSRCKERRFEPLQYVSVGA
jgi:hypothetical protein